MTLFDTPEKTRQALNVMRSKKLRRVAEIFVTIKPQHRHTLLSGFLLEAENRNICLDDYIVETEYYIGSLIEHFARVDCVDLQPMLIKD